MQNNGLHTILSSKNIKLLICFTSILVFFSNCQNSYSQSVYGKLEGITIGNGMAFHPNQKSLLISKPTEVVGENGNPFYRIFQLKFEDGVWCCEVEVSVSSDFNDYHPVFSPDGKWVYFNSDRPIPNSSIKADKMNIWRVKYHNGNWSIPEYLTEINTENHESYPSISNNGTLYFNSDRAGGKGSMDIYKSEYVDGKFSKPIPIVDLNSKDSENDLVIDPDEKFIIFNRYLFDEKEIEMYLSYKKGKSWTEPQPLNAINKKKVWELTPTLSPDGKHFFFEVDGKINFVLLDSIKEK